jgi:predicted DNA-binding transcriptional regulator AlpA
MSETAIQEKLDQLLQLYGNMPTPAPTSDYERIKGKIKSGDGFTTVKDYCTYRDCCTATVYNHIARDVLPKPVKIGGSTLFRNSELLAMEEAL